MRDKLSTGRQAKQVLALREPPIAIGFLDSFPDNLPRWSGGPVAAGCVFWVKAMEGESFYTLPDDHLNCPVGCHTHRIALPPERAHELDAAIACMVEAGYLDFAEIPDIPRLARTPAAIAYGPADEPGFPADVILIATQPAQAMLLYEACVKAKASAHCIKGLGRPACGVLPLAMNTAQAAASFGCKGNRTFTGLPDDELYLAIPADKWQAVVTALLETLSANALMQRHYQQKQAEGYA
jgi:uncharacterized protein (DUF169 family)